MKVQPKQVQAKFKLQEEPFTCLTQTGENFSWSLILASLSSGTIFRFGPTNKRQLKLAPVWIRLGRVVNWRLLALFTKGDLCCFVSSLFYKCRVSPPTKTSPSQLQTSRGNSHLSESDRGEFLLKFELGLKLVCSCTFHLKALRKKSREMHSRFITLHYLSFCPN